MDPLRTALATPLRCGPSRHPAPARPGWGGQGCLRRVRRHLGPVRHLAARQLGVHRRRERSRRRGFQCRRPPTARPALAVGDHISASSAAASRPIAAALGAMLYDRFIAVEMMAFDQVPAGERTADVQSAVPTARRRRSAMSFNERPDAVRVACGHRVCEPAPRSRPDRRNEIPGSTTRATSNREFHFGA